MYLDKLLDHIVALKLILLLLFRWSSCCYRCKFSVGSHTSRVSLFYWLYIFCLFCVEEKNISKTLQVVSIFFRYFPKIFGPGQDEPLDKQRSYKAFQELSDEVSSFVYWMFRLLFCIFSSCLTVKNLWILRKHSDSRFQKAVPNDKLLEVYYVTELTT